MTQTLNEKNQLEIEEKFLKLIERRDTILKSNKDYLESKEELLVLFEQFLKLEKNLLIEKGGKLIEKEEYYKNYLKNLSYIKEMLGDELYADFISLS